MSEHRILIVGGGIAGLSAAAALRRAGFVHVELVEKAQQWRPVGAGLILQQNATTILKALGLELHNNHALSGLVLADKDGTPLTRTGFSTTMPKSITAHAIHRAALHELLLGACEGVDIRLGTSVTGIKQENETVEVTFTDNRATCYDLVVGADGVHSVMRKLLGRDPTQQFRPAGYGCWRCVLPNRIALREAVELWGDGTRIGMVPLGEEHIYCFLVISGTEQTGDQFNQDMLRRRFSGYGYRTNELLSLITNETPLIWNDLGELPPFWGDGRVVLVGDAAHAMTPNMGQGAAMALEDVAVLTLELTSANRIDDALARFGQRRSPRIASIQKQSAAVGRLAHIASPTGRRLRNIILRRLPRGLTEKSTTRLVAPGVGIGEALAQLLNAKRSCP